MKVSGHCKKGYMFICTCVLGRPRAFVLQTAQRKSVLLICLLSTFLPNLSIAHMRVNICFAVCVCHLQNWIGSSDKIDTEVSLCSVRNTLGLTYSSWCCPVILLHHNFGGWRRKEEGSPRNREHQPIICFGIKLKRKLTTGLHSEYLWSPGYKSGYLLYLKSYNRIGNQGLWEIKGQILFMQPARHTAEIQTIGN